MHLSYLLLLVSKKVLHECAFIFGQLLLVQQHSFLDQSEQLIIILSEHVEEQLGQVEQLLVLSGHLQQVEEHALGEGEQDLAVFGGGVQQLGGVLQD